MNGKQQTGSISKALPVERIITEVLILALLGAAAVFLRARLRIPLNMPGHHGLEVMALLMIARNYSSIPFAGSIATLTGGLLMFIPFLGYTNPFLPLAYFLMGALIDIIYSWFRNFRHARFFFILTGGLAYMILPLTRLVFHFTGLYPYKAIIKAGIPYTLLSHFLFGIAGAALGAALIYSARKIKR
jgi:hypothetical protein